MSLVPRILTNICKAVPAQAIWTFRKSIFTAPLIRNLRTKWRWVVNYTLRPVYPLVKSNRYPWNRRPGGSQSRYGRWRRDKSLTLTGIWTQDPPTRSLKHTNSLHIVFVLHSSSTCKISGSYSCADNIFSERCYSSDLRIQTSQMQQTPKCLCLYTYINGVTPQRLEYSILPPNWMSIFRRFLKIIIRKAIF